jgi:hypothetical protein
MGINKCTEHHRLKSIEDRQNRQDVNLDKIYDKLDIIEINTASLPELKTDIKDNSEFRIKANGIVALISFISTAFGGILVWLASKFIGGK